MRTILVVAFLAAMTNHGGCHPSPADPCEGKGCGDACVCASDDPACSGSAVGTSCDADGACVASGTFICPVVDPCAGKVCGDVCVIDPPCRPLCMVPSIFGHCDASGVCQPEPAVPVCPAGT